ncbi:MAG: T9SS type A sorting domain-containing protein, partial [Dysgonamonadaceae bacterium]|nr:T9SS type A sorting domain-containing protein [Dysgonamonadaceae bacterium]
GNTGGGNTGGGNTGSGNTDPNPNNICVEICFGIRWIYECGDDIIVRYEWHCYHYGNCPITGNTITGGPGPGIGGPVGPGGGGYYYGGGGTGNYPTIITDCDSCRYITKQKLIDCGMSFIPVYGCIKGEVDCYKSYNKPNRTWRDNAKCVLTHLGCVAEMAGAKIIGWIANAISCLIDFTECTPTIKSSISLRSSKPSYMEDFGNTIDALLPELEAHKNILLENFGNEVWLDCSNDDITTLINYLLSLDENELIDIDDSNLQNVIPIGISSENFYKFIERLNNTSRRLNGETVNANYIDQDLLDHYFDEILAVENMAKSIGYESSNDMWEKKYAEFLSNLNESSSSVCASISLQFSQTMTMTRQAFRGTLTVFNGHESIPMENVRLDLVVKDKLGNIATSHEFQINNENIQDFGGDLNGSWSLDAQKTGVATVVFIPTKYAAPTEPVEYSFGGSLSYIDPFTGLEVIRDLNPVTLTVKPSPNLDLTYFMQRDILGDDPLTPEIEPLVPAEFSLIIHNVGVGEATNIRMVTQQPKIVDNQKGLFIDFELLSSQLNGGEHTLALGGSLPSDFGNIPSGKTAYAQWWFTGSLLGHFINYDVQATHVTSYGNPDLTLLNDVSIHELIRSINANDADNSLLTGFMVNDIPDAEDLPDMLYLSDGTVETVSHAGNMVCVSEGNNQYRLTVTPSAIGWNYGAVNDPTGGRQQLIEIKRVSDNAVIDLRNCWQTDRTLRDGKDPLYENRLHIVDKFVNGQQYMLTFTPAPDVFLEVESFEGTPEGVSSTAVQEITVRFNKNIDATTFTVTDIRLICQGENIDTDLISITPVNERTFKLGLSAVTQRDGYYVLTVQTSGITDSEGYQGKIGKTTDWNQYSGGKMQFNLKIEPENGGTVTPPAGKYDYSSTLNLLAVPNEGYLFEKWSINGETLSTEPAYSFTLLSDKTLKAAFKLKLYDVTVNCDKNAGRIVGSGSGKYEHGSHLSLKAEPFAGYLFAGWTVNGNSNTDNMLDITVDSDKIIEALFTKHIIITTDTTNISTNICQGEIYDFFGTGLTESGSYEYILQNVSGGDSIIVLNLTVNPYPAVPTVTVEGTHTLVSSALNNNQWYDENGAIEGATDQSFIPTVSGVYHVTNSNGNCESEASESYYVNLSNEIKIDWDLVPKWNWVSINSMQATPVESLLAPVKSKIEQIVGYNSEAIVSESGFTGNLTVMTAKESYKFKLNSQAVMTLTGAVSPTTEVTVQLIAGWNWIGYLPVVNLTTANALAGLSPSVNDVVKNQTDFSVYDGQKWTGSLKEMKQGDGYMYFSATAKTFTWSSLRAAKVESSTLRSSATPIWEYDAHKYRDNMNIVAQLSVNGQIPAEGIYTVGAFQGNECRGIGKYANGRLFITVHGEIAGETVTFKAYENATGKEYGIEETLPFADALKGTFAQPVTLSIKGLSMPENFETPSFIIYPNPVKGSLYISGSNLSAIKAIKILTVTGSVVLATDNYDKGQGIDAGSLPNGSYILAICLDDNVIYRKFVKFR